MVVCKHGAKALRLYGSPNIAKQANKTRRGSNGLLGTQVQGDNNDEVDHRVDKTADHHEHQHIQPQVTRRGQQDGSEGKKDRHHTEYGHHAAPPTELIREPTQKNGRGDAAKLNRQDGNTAARQSRTLDFTEIHRPPIEHAVAGDVGKEIREGEQPDPLVHEDLIDEELLETKLLFVGAVFDLVLGKVIIVFLNRR